MSKKDVLKVENLGKKFKIYNNPWHRVLEWISPRKKVYHKAHWALKNISFELTQGEFFGIIGMNGAGKSTLLKIISGILSPTEGGFSLNEPAFSLLSLGGNLDPMLTGRENVQRSGQLLNLPHNYLDEYFENICEFSELGDYFDRPVYMYSSGMRVRLSFSIFAFLKNDVLILDEVLSVGDIFFRQKCYQRLEDLIAAQTSIMLVTHNMGVVQRFCNRAMVLHEGKQVFIGAPDEAIEVYSQLKRTSEIGKKSKTKKFDTLSQAVLELDADAMPTKKAASNYWPPENVGFSIPPGERKSPRAQLTFFALCNEYGTPQTMFQPNEWVYLYYALQLEHDIQVPVGVLSIRDNKNFLVHSKSSLVQSAAYPQVVRQGEIVRFRQKVKLSLSKGHYTLGLSFYTIPIEVAAQFETLLEAELKTNTHPLNQYKSLVSFRVSPDSQKIATFGGLCDLPGECEIELVENGAVS